MTGQTTRRVVITGMSVISPLGNTLDALWESLQAKRSGVRALVAEGGATPGALAMAYGGLVEGFTGQIEDFGPLDKDEKRAIRKAVKLMCREIQMGVAAAQLAITHAELGRSVRDPERTGVVYGCDHVVTTPEEFLAGVAACVATERSETRFKFSRWAQEGLPKVTPLWLLKYLPNMPASHIAIFNDLRGPNNSLTYREASGNLAIGEACATIQRGSADCMLAGATGCNISVLKSIFVSQQSQLAEGILGTGHGSLRLHGGALRQAVAPEALSRPFDRHRTGMVAGEGAAAVVLEEYSHAKARGATIYGEVLGHGSSVAVDQRCRANAAVALENALRATLRSAGCDAREVGHVHAHGLSAVQSDIDESRALNAVFRGESAIPVVAAKSHFGNLGAASGVVELIGSLQALRHGNLFPVLNYEHPDPACPVAVVRDSTTPAGSTFVNLNITPQGQASAVLIGLA